MKTGIPFFIHFLCSSFFFMIFTGCPFDPFGDEGRVVIMTYNVQNLFDDVSQGGEYPEYDPDSSDWNSDSYLGKLSALSEAIRKSPETPDIILFQEVENRTVLKHLAEDFLLNAGYDFYAAPVAEGSAAQTGVLSRRPVVSLYTHRPGASEGERNILEIHLDLDGETLVLFNNHWKSRRGGADITEEERRRAAEDLKYRLKMLQETAPDTPYILAGDFNEDPWEDDRAYPPALGVSSETNPPVLRVPGLNPPELLSEECEEALIAGCFWQMSADEGSYCYSGIWERIDNFFWSEHLQDRKGWEIISAIRVDDSLLLNEYGSPAAFDADSLEGFSDHLPLIIILEKE